MKMPASLDGTRALANGQNQWITSPEVRPDGHDWRAHTCTALTGVGTVLEDNPASMCAKWLHLASLTS